jgi:hypothetical protein
MQFAEHLVEGLLRGDSQSRAEFYSKLFAVGAITANQIARTENLPLAGREGDVHYVPSNFTAMKAIPATEEPPAPAADREVGPPLQVIAAHRALLLDVTSRVIRREVDRARRGQTTPQKLRAHADAYYDQEFEDLVVDMLLPAVRAQLAWSERADEAATLLRPIVRDHLAESVRQLRACADQHTILADNPDYHLKVGNLLNRWELERADTLADRLLQVGSETAPSLPVLQSRSQKTIAEMQRELQRLMQPTDGELNRQIERQKRQVAEMRKNRLQRESAERVTTLVKN